VSEKNNQTHHACYLMLVVPLWTRTDVPRLHLLLITKIALYELEARGWFSILSVSLSPDGNTLVIGSTLGLGGGYVQVFSLANVGDVDVDVDADTWTQIGQRIVSDANGNDFGWSVAISDNGRTLAVGAPDFI
jgi:hypothetical protein